MLRVEEGRENRTAYRRLKNLQKDTRRGVQDGLLQLRLQLIKEAVRLMELPKSGRVYTVYRSKTGRRLKRGRKHVASKKGEAPAILSGDLRRSLGTSIKYGQILTFGAGVAYAKYLENGGRPFLSTAILNLNRNAKEWIGSSVEKRLRRKK